MEKLPKWIKNIVYLLCFFVLWQIVFFLDIFPELLFPSPFAVANSFLKAIMTGDLFSKTAFSLYLIFYGIIISILLTIVMTVSAEFSGSMNELFASLIALIDPLPGVALLPIAILWFGIGNAAVIFVIVHSVLWPLLLSMQTGIKSVPLIYKEVGQNIGLSKGNLLLKIYLPTAIPYIISGFRTGWSRAWRAAISAEMVFGASGVAGGLGWDIFIKRGFMDIPGMFASLFMIMLIGLFMEDCVFKQIEKRTVVKWGMIHG